MTSYETRYNDLIASIDVAQAGRDEYGDLRWHVICSAEGDATDMQAEGTAEKTNEGFYKAAFEIAEFILDDWKSYYPQLVIEQGNSSQ